MSTHHFLRLAVVAHHLVVVLERLVSAVDVAAVEEVVAPFLGEVEFEGELFAEDISGFHNQDINTTLRRSQALTNE